MDVKTERMHNGGGREGGGDGPVNVWKEELTIQTNIANTTNLLVD